MLTPGFIIKNETIWNLQLSLNQVGPLYFGVIKPGEIFQRSTGSVYFTIRASIFLDEADRITEWDAILPVAAIVGTVVISAITAGAAAYAGGPAYAAAAASGVAGVKGLSSAGMLATAVAASQLVNAGFKAGAALIIGGVVVGGGTGAAASATVQAALREIFKKQNVSVSRAGAYAGPPWPFRRHVQSLSITGGPTYRRTDDDKVEVVGRPLRIGPTQPLKPFSQVRLHTDTALATSDETYRFLLGSNNDLVVIKTGETRSGMTELYTLTAQSHYQSFGTHAVTVLGFTDETWDFALAANRDLFAIRKRGTDSGSTEVHVLSADSNYQRYVLQTGTGQAETDDSWSFCVAADNRDVIGIKRNKTDSGRTEVHVLAADGYSAASYGRTLGFRSGDQPRPLRHPPLEHRHGLDRGSHPDLGIELRQLRSADRHGAGREQFALGIRRRHRPRRLLRQTQAHRVGDDRAARVVVVHAVKMRR